VNYNEREIMKRIIIHGKENSNQIILTDNDDNDLLSYTKELSKIMESSKISILETTSGNLLIRPLEIFSIQVEEIDNKNSVTKKTLFNKEDVIKD